ncbi:Pulmonary surfactant-associated protein D [Myotis brandtii]|uniref:Pulmonary surfactant-associated protein D n=1 Tax=Myotis brandtii TaxID=109478 RepID=S7PRP4_MYOBR|nr:Pulmonary surfactant-associated protein D [Myotis brandtii]
MCTPVSWVTTGLRSVEVECLHLRNLKECRADLQVLLLLGPGPGLCPFLLLLQVHQELQGPWGCLDLLAQLGPKGTTVLLENLDQRETRGHVDLQDLQVCPGRLDQRVPQECRGMWDPKVNQAPKESLGPKEKWVPQACRALQGQEAPQVSEEKMVPLVSVEPLGFQGKQVNIAALRQQVEALQGQVGRLQGAFIQCKKVELFPNGRGVDQKVFKAAGFQKPFQEAQQVCAQAGGQLPSPRSAAENKALQQLIEVENKGAAFLSMTDSKTEGKFIYPGGESLVYSNWKPGEPNNKGGNEDCVEIFTNGKWNDIPCEEKRLVICEF